MSDNNTDRDEQQGPERIWIDAAPHLIADATRHIYVEPPPPHFRDFNSVEYVRADLASCIAAPQEAAKAPATPSDAAMRAAEEIGRSVAVYDFKAFAAHLAKWTHGYDKDAALRARSTLAAIITRNLATPIDAPESDTSWEATVQACRKRMDAADAAATTSPEIPVGGEAERFVTAAFAYLDTIAGGDVCNDRTCIRCRIADAVFEVERSIPTVPDGGNTLRTMANTIFAEYEPGSKAYSFGLRVMEYLRHENETDR